MKRWRIHILVLSLSIPALPSRAQISGGDTDRDLDTDLNDLAMIVTCLVGPAGEVTPACADANLDRTGAVDLRDFAKLQAGYSPWSRITHVTPSNGENMVSLTRGFIVTIPNGLQMNPHSVTTNNVFAVFGGNRLSMLSGSPRVIPDGKRIKMFFDPPLPAAARVRVTIDGTTIIDRNGYPIDADGDGAPGGTRRIDFDTCPDTRIPDTVVWGYVKDNRSEEPIEGVTISADEVPEIISVTDPSGLFWLGSGPPPKGCTPQDACAAIEARDPKLPCHPGEVRGVPVPGFFVHIDGTTAMAVGGQPVPADGFYPNVGKPFHSSAGHCIQIEMDHTPFDVFMPFIPDESIEPVAPAEETTVGLSPEGEQRLCELFPDYCAANPDAANLLQLTVPAGSLTHDDGSPGSQIGIFPVPTNRLPAPPPPSGPIHTMDLTINADADNFDIPAPICFPNLPDPETGESLQPGDKAGLLSFNHDTGQWDYNGSMSTTDDGASVCPDDGVGVLAPGWHGTGPAGEEPPEPCTSDCCDVPCCPVPTPGSVASRDNCQCRCLSPLECCPDGNRCGNPPRLSMCLNDATTGRIRCFEELERWYKEWKEACERAPFDSPCSLACNMGYQSGRALCQCIAAHKSCQCRNWFGCESNLCIPCIGDIVADTVSCFSRNWRTVWFGLHL